LSRAHASEGLDHQYNRHHQIGHNRRCCGHQQLDPSCAPRGERQGLRAVLIAEQSKNWTVGGVVAKMQGRTTFVAIDRNDVVGTAGFDGQQARTVFVR
jgi:hypothetical protein